MKLMKFFLSMALIVFGFNFFANESSVFAAEEVGTNPGLTLDELSPEDREIFIENGFTEEDVFFEDYISMPTNENEMSVKAIVAKVVGSTKRETTNRAKTTYTITCYTDTMNSIEVQTTATSGSTKRVSSASSRPNSRTAVVSTYTSYSGASKYFAFKGSTQITTPQGSAGTVFSTTAGGVTLGY